MKIKEIDWNPPIESPEILNSARRKMMNGSPLDEYTAKAKSSLVRAVAHHKDKSRSQNHHEKTSLGPIQEVLIKQRRVVETPERLREKY